MITIDFETAGIVGNPILNPPKPIGASIKQDDGPSRYFQADDPAFEPMLRLAYGSDEELIFHNAPFDLAVAEKWCGLKPPPWYRVHDTTFLVYLENPHAPSLSLKPSAQRILRMHTEDRDDLRDWIIENVRGATKKTWGAHIDKAPNDLVEQYAEMDTDMTYALFAHLHPIMPRDAYNLERELQPYLVAATKHGIRLDQQRLSVDIEVAELQAKAVEEMIHTALNMEFDIHNGAQLADALDKAGKVKEWKLTPTGKRSTSRPNLMSCLDDQELLSQLSYAGALRTCMGTFMKPWMQLAASDGRLHPNWNQVRGEDYGTRTGRLSCDHPNLQNVANEFTFLIPAGLAPLPQMRSYLLPEEGDRWYSRDFSGQEMRILAHFEKGTLLQSFQENPDLDPHAMVQQLIHQQTGLNLTRKVVKRIGFGLIYGMGAPGLSRQLKVEPHEAMRMIEAYHHALPGVSELQRQTQNIGCYSALARKANRDAKLWSLARKNDELTQAQVAQFRKRSLAADLRVPTSKVVTTFGGREYPVETPKMVNQRMQSFEYKLLNYLIQGSAADQTKRSMLHWFKNRPANQTFLATVHDEINISVPIWETDKQLCWAMDHSLEGLDVPMRSTLKTGTNWGNIK